MSNHNSDQELFIESIHYSKLHLEQAFIFLKHQKSYIIYEIISD
jgi:hypothetical protein